MIADGPVVMVTGATGDLGRVVVRRFALDRVRLVLVGTDRDRLVAVAAEAALPDGRWLPIVADLRDRDAARVVAATAEGEFGRTDALVHLVGGWVGGTPVVDLDPLEVHGMLDQHLWTTLHIVQAVVPGMIARGHGRVVAISSSLAESPGPRGASYALAKAAEEVLLRSLAREVGGDGVTANLLVVRTIDVAHQRETAPSPKTASWTTPEEIADTIAFLVSPAAAAINGARIPLNGRA